MKYILDKTKRPVYLQLYQQLRSDIIEEVYAYNSKLPSKRILAEECGVSTITVEHTYDLLCEEGYIEARERSGYYVIFRKKDGFVGTERSDIGVKRTDEASFSTHIPAFGHAESVWIPVDISQRSSSS